MQPPLPTAAAAQAVQIGFRTLRHWMRTGRVQAPALRIRRGRAVRLWSATDLKRLRRVRERTFGQGRVGRPKKKL